MSNLARSALILVICNILSKVLGFGREIVLATKYGTSYISDAFLIANSISGLLFGGIGAAVLTCYIHLYNDISLNNKFECICNNGHFAKL